MSFAQAYVRFGLEQSETYRLMFMEDPHITASLHGFVALKLTCPNFPATPTETFMPTLLQTLRRLPERLTSSRKAGNVADLRARVLPHLGHEVVIALWRLGRRARARSNYERGVKQ